MKKLLLSLLLSAVTVFAFAENTKYKGDINDDGEISLADMVKLASHILNNGAYTSAYDLNNDKKIDDTDLQQLADIILNNIKSPQSGLDVGIGDWGDGGEFGGVVGARRNITSSLTPFSISETKWNESNSKYYFDVNLAENNSTVYCSAIINIKLPQNLGFSLDGNRIPLVECTGEECITNGHKIYGKPTLQSDGSLRFIVFNKQLTDFKQATGAIARVYVTSRETQGSVVVLPSELATKGNNGVGSVLTRTEKMSFGLKEANVFKLTYMVDGVEYRSVEVKYGDKITPEAAPEKAGCMFSGWSNLPETMPAHDVTVTGTFSANTYKLIYMVDGVEYKTVDVKYGDKITLEAAPQKEGHSFSGWSNLPETMPAHDVTVTGTFSANTYKLIYKVDGVEYKTVDVKYGDKITPEAAPEKEGCTFSGWSNIPETMPAHDVTVTGTFSANTYKLIYMVDGVEYKTLDVKYGEKITPEAAPQKEGHSFSGWSNLPETMPAHDVTVTGTFSANTYRLTYMVDGEEYKAYEVKYGEKITPEAAPQKEGCTFSGWSNLPETMPAHDVTVTGTFSANTYRLTYMVDGEEYKAYEVKYGDKITPEAAPQKEGYTFSGWSYIPETMPARDITITGTFSVNTYKFTYVVDGEVYKTVDVKFGEQITPEAEPEKEGHTFSGWSDIPETMPAENVIVMGTFSANVYTLTYVVDEEVYKTIDVKYGGKIIPEAAPEKEGYTFSGWSNLPETMPAHDVTVTGIFSANTYRLTYMVDGSEYKVYEVKYGDKITPEAAPEKEGHSFSGWNNLPETMPAHDVTVAGTFSANTYKLIYMVDGVEYKAYEVKYGDKITPEAAPQKEGYTFSGWSYIPETMPARDITVTGTFTIIPVYKLIYVVDGEEYKVYELEYGEQITPEPEPQKEGYTFSGWSEIPETMPANAVIVTGTFSPNTYKLIYKVDGKEYKTLDVKYGTQITPEAAPEKEGYTFSGWSEIPETMPAHDVIVEGTFSVNVYKLTYLVDGAEYKVYELAYGTQITPESAPEKEGHTFSGWSEIPETMPAHDVTVTGSFSANTYKLIYRVDGEEYKTVEVMYGTRITPEAAPEKEGYTFSGWSEIPETMPAHDVIVEGTFSVNVYKLTYLVDGEEYKVYELEYGSQITPEPAPEKEGYTFSGWIYIPETMPAKDITVIGSFSVNTYKLTYIVDGEEYKTMEVKYGEQIIPEVEPEKEGYTFSGWSEIPETMPAHDVTVEGTFSANIYKLTYLVDDEEYKVYELEYGTQITPESAPEKEGHTFSGWSEIPETMPAHDVTVTGTFSVNTYKLIYMVDGEEYKVCELEYGEEITPEPDPEKEGYTFSGWSEIPETMPAHDVTVTGTFTINTAINSLYSSEQKVNVYNLNGTKIYERISMKEALEQLPKGIYIINGRKIYIK